MTQNPHESSPDMPDPHHRFPDIPGLDPTQAALWSLEDVDGVPYPYIFQTAVDIARWNGQLHGGEYSPELAAEISAGMREREQAYPGSPVWERYRSQIAHALLPVAGLERTVDFLAEGLSSHHVVETAVDLLARRQREGLPGGWDGPRLFSELMARVGNERKIDLVRAFADLLIEGNLHSPELDRYEDLWLSLRSVAGKPPVTSFEGWLEAQQRRRPNFDWESAKRFILDDSAWENVPIRYRQFAVGIFYQIRQTLAVQSGADSVERALAFFHDRVEQAYPGLEVWQKIRVRLAVDLLRSGHAQTAVEIGRAVSSKWQYLLVADLLKNQAAEEATQLTFAISEPNDLIQALLLEDWPESRGQRLLESICWNDASEYPLAARIQWVEALHDMLVMDGRTELAAKYAERLEALRSQQDSAD